MIFFFYLLFWLVMPSHDSLFFEAVMVDDTRQYVLLSIEQSFRMVEGSKNPNMIFCGIVRL
jgi:hypothetical protein